MLKKGIYTFIFFLIIVQNAFGQKTTEFGLFIGRSYYLGEINPTTHLGGGVGSLAYGGLFRLNLNNRYSLKLAAYKAKLATEDRFTELRFNRFRDASFEGDLIEVSPQIEFNFLPYQMGDKKFFFSPYLFVGLAFYSIESDATVENFETVPVSTKSGMQFALPFGPGLKLNVGKKMSLNFEWGFRRTSNDQLDGLSNRFNEIFELGKEYDNDWYVISGFALTYKLTKVGPCPAIEF